MVTNSEQSFHWTGYGFKLHIPQDSLPAGVGRCLLHISASIAGQYQFPDNMELVSAVYWVRCEPYCRFQQPLTAELQHCANTTSSTKLTFVRALCSQEHLPYTFKEVDRRDSFAVQSSYGSLQLNHFSGIALAGRNIERLYTASLYYLPGNPRNTEIHLVITWDDEVHLKVNIYEVCRSVGRGHSRSLLIQSFCNLHRTIRRLLTCTTKRRELERVHT